MPKFLIEVPHEPDELACAKVVQVDDCGREYQERGSHDRAQAFRGQASIVQLNRFSMDQIDSILDRHRVSRSGL